MDVTLVEPTSPRWTAVLAHAEHDFYHLPRYAELCARLEGGQARALLVEDAGTTVLLPLTVRSIPGSEAWDAASPYGYSGPVVVGAGHDGEGLVVTRALEAGREKLRREGCVSLFVRLHPLIGARPSIEGPAALVQHGSTVHVDLSKSEAELWAETMSGHRNEINRALRAGHRAYFDDAFEHGARFVDIYLATMTRVGAAASYMFDHSYLVELREALGGRLKLAVVEIEGQIAAAALFVATGPIVQYHLSGTDDAFLRERPTKLMLHFVRRWAKERGFRWLHLGGGVGGHADSLFRFKAGFSKQHNPFYTLRMVVDPAAYRALSRKQHPEADDGDLGGFFPLYRRP
jgi:hypothetical protein